MDYLSKEVSENPNNGYAHMTMAILQADAENYNDAMTSINLAIKKLPKKDKEYTGRAYASRAHLYAIAGDTITALADLDKAIRINPDNEDVQEALGQVLYELKRYDDADILGESGDVDGAIAEWTRYLQTIRKMFRNPYK